MEALKECRICPRSCGVNRLAGETGFCGETGELVNVARAGLHMWEEPCISGERGSGTVFFAGCNLGCVYCQNRQISTRKYNGVAVSIDRLAEIFTELQAQGAHNINLVTPTHYSLHIIEAASKARASGLNIPIVYNCGGYEKPETIALLKDTVDIFLTDFKYFDAGTADAYSGAPDYFDAALEALETMVDNVGEPVFDPEGIMQKGVIVRHMVLPGRAEQGAEILKCLYRRFGDSLVYSIMNQYTPPADVSLPEELRRGIFPEEYDCVLDAAERLGIQQGYIQEGGTVDESFIPAFDGFGVLKTQ